MAAPIAYTRLGLCSLSGHVNTKRHTPPPSVRNFRPMISIRQGARAVLIGLLVLLAWPAGVLHGAEADDFLNPPLKYKTRPLWFWNNTAVTAAGVAEQMQQARDKDGYGGFGILPFGTAFKPAYLSDDYFALYGEALRKAKELGMSLCIYDEFGFPSGSAGASNGDGTPRFANAFPDDTIKRLDKHDEDVAGPSLYQKLLPPGQLMACVAMNLQTKERRDLAAACLLGAIKWQVPAGKWKIMSFVCVKDGDPNVDYLDAAACDKFVGMTHQKYYDHFKADMGPDKTIDGTFYDEPTMYRAQGRIWTGRFNERFTARYHLSPALLYPALWYDIGPDTEAARNCMFGMRSELYATGFAKSVQDWCHEHGNLPSTGHQDQEEIVNPCNVSGDLMKCFKYQDIPGIDRIGGPRPTESFYKIVSSSANNYDKSRVMSETYGAMGNLGWDQIYHIAMDQYTKGINMLIPHAVWYDPGKVTFLPELSWRNPLYAQGLPEFNKFMGRLNLLLQNEARHVADIGVLYPIATLQGGNRLDGPLGFYEGGVTVPEADYVNVGALLSDTICRDFTFVHPEVLDEKCAVTGASIELSNTLNPERFGVFIMPGHRTIQWSNLQKIKAFYDAGGKVIATRMLPGKSAEFGHDDDVVRTIAAMFPERVAGPTASASTAWSAGGFDAMNAIDGSRDTRWNAADKAPAGQWLEIDFHAPQTFSRTVVSENFGRITAYEIQAWNGTAWQACAKGASVGERRVDTFQAVTAAKVRLLIKSVSADSPSIAEFEVYGRDGRNLASGDDPQPKTNAKGGKCYFLALATAANLRQALDDAVPVYDVRFEGGASVQYIHKVRANRNIYLFSNLGGAAVDTFAKLRGKQAPQLWDPHTGRIVAQPEFTCVREHGQDITRVRLNLAKDHSVFVISAAN